MKSQILLLGFHHLTTLSAPLLKRITKTDSEQKIKKLTVWYVRFTSVAVRHSCGAALAAAAQAAVGLVPKQDSKKLAHIRMLMVSIFSKRSKLENLYLQIWAYLRRRRRCTALELVVDQSGSLDVSQSPFKIL